MSEQEQLEIKRQAWQCGAAFIQENPQYSLSSLDTLRRLAVHEFPDLPAAPEQDRRDKSYDYRRVTGCEHALHEGCATCTCPSCGTRAAKCHVEGSNVTLWITTDTLYEQTRSIPPLSER